jgi:hypothetical protein
LSAGDGAEISQNSDKAAGWTMQRSNPDRGRRFISPPKRPDRLRGQPSFSFNGYRQIFAGNGVGKQLGCDAYHALPYSAEAKNEWSPISTPYVFIECTGTALLLFD